MTNETTMLTPRDQDTSQDLEVLTLGEDDHDEASKFVRDEIPSWLSTDGERPLYTPFYFTEGHETAEKIPPEVIAKAIYNGKYGFLPCYYTQLYEDYPLLVAAELIKKIKWYSNQTLRPRYLVEIIRIYRIMSTYNWRNGWPTHAVKFYGPLAINMAGIYKHTALSIDLANEFPKLLNGKPMPESISLYMKCVNRWHMDGRQQGLSTKEISEAISKEWKATLLDSAPILRAAWDSTITLEQV